VAVPARGVTRVGGKRQVLYLALGVVLLIGLLGASQAALVAQTPEPQPSSEASRTLEGLLTSVPPPPGGTDEATPGGTAGVPLQESTPDAPGPGAEPEPNATRLLDGVIETRTPVPTATPGRIEQEVNQLAYRTGLAWTEFLGLQATDWINLGISLLFILAGYLIGTWLIRSMFPRLVRRTATEFDDAFLSQAGPGLRWLVVIVILQFATTRLVFVSAGLKSILTDVYFVLGLLLAFRIVWRSVDLAEPWYHHRSVKAGREDELAPVFTLLVRVGRVVVAFIGLTVLLSHFGVSVAAFTAALGLGGLAFSLAARDTIADAIAGFIILVDRPFRIGDRIEIQGVGTWGDVTDIGLRTTRIRTRDNRMVIVPNSVIGSNQVINYTYPDPRYRIETRVGIAYGTDIEMARRVIVEAVHQVEGVLSDKPVDALYAEMGDSAMIFRVRWWIESYRDTRRMFDKVHTALQQALDEAGIECPFPTQTLNLQVESQAVEQITQELGTEARPGAD
jgi:MscS family membrane protein